MSSRNLQKKPDLISPDIQKKIDLACAGKAGKTNGSFALVKEAKLALVKTFVQDASIDLMDAFEKAARNKPVPANMPKARWRFVDKELADKCLARMARNRKMNRRVFDKIVAALRNGEWQLTGETIQICKNGKVINGRHRLSAISFTGIGAWILVVSGVSEGARHVIDTGSSKNEAALLDITYCEDEAQFTLSWANVHHYVISPSHKAQSHHYGKAWGDKNRNAVIWGKRFFGEKTVKGEIRKGPVAGAFVIAYRASPTKVAEAARMIAYGVDLRLGSPPHLIFQYLSAISRGEKKREDRRTTTKRILTGLYAHIHGKKITSLEIDEKAVAELTKDLAPATERRR